MLSECDLNIDQFICVINSVWKLDPTIQYFLCYLLLVFGNSLREEEVIFRRLVFKMTFQMWKIRSEMRNQTCILFHNL